MYKSEDGEDANVELHASLAATGEYITQVNLPRRSTAAELCKAVFEAEVAAEKKGPFAFHLYSEGRIIDGRVPLAALGLQGRASADFLRLRPLSVVTITVEGQCRTFNAENQQLTRTIFGARSAEAPGSYSPDSDRMVGLTVPSTGASPASSSRTARVIDAVSGQSLMSLVGHRMPVLSAAFSWQGFHVATASVDSTAVLWNARTGEQLQVLRGHKGEVTFVTFFPAGRRVITTSTDCTAIIWSVATGQSAVTLRGHRWAVTHASCSADGRWVLTGSEDRTAKLWNAETGECVRTFEGHESPVEEVLISGCWDSEAAAAELAKPVPKTLPRADVTQFPSMGGEAKAE